MARPIILAALALLLFPATGAYPASTPEAVKVCHGYSVGAASAEERIAACTSAIDAGELSDYDKARAYDSRARLHRDRQDFEAAIADFSSAIELKPDSDDYYYQRAATYKVMGRREAAIADYGKVVELDDGDFLARDALSALGVTPPPAKPFQSDDFQSGRACYFGW